MEQRYHHRGPLAVVGLEVLVEVPPQGSERKAELVGGQGIAEGIGRVSLRQPRAQRQPSNPQ